MAITQANLKAKIAAYINRTSAELITPANYDLVLDAMNMVKLGAQRKQDFKMCRKPGFISTSLAGAQMSTITSDQAAQTPLVMKKIESVWTVTTANNTAFRGQRVPGRSFGDEKLFHPSVNQYWNTVPTTLPAGTQLSSYLSNQILWWQQGTAVYVSGIFTPTQYWVDGIAFLPDYDGTSGTDDFFLTYHHDWLFVATLDYMNLYLKEDARVQISSTKMEQLWNSVISYDEQFSEANFDMDDNN